MHTKVVDGPLEARSWSLFCTNSEQQLYVPLFNRGITLLPKKLIRMWSIYMCAYR